MLKGLEEFSQRRENVPLSSNVVIGVFAVIDSMAIFLSGVVLHDRLIFGSLFDADNYIASILFVWLISLFVFHYAGLHEFKAIMSPFNSLVQILVATFTSFLFLMAVLFALKVSDSISRVWAFSFVLTSFGAIFLARIIGCYIIYYLASTGLFARNVVIVGGGKQAEKLLEQLESEKPKLNNVVGVFDDRYKRIGSVVGGVPVIGDLENLEGYIRLNRIDDIIVTLPWSADDRLTSIVARLRTLPANIHLGSDLVGFRFKFRPSPKHFVGIPMMEVVKAPLSGWGVLIKWFEDKILAILLIALFSPVLLAVAIAVRFESPGPIVFKQRRYGYNNEVFFIYKFRSMYHNSSGRDDAKVKQATRGDTRITRVGNFIRRTSLDELPQLFNVVMGDMSLVGPRPHAVDHNEEYAALIAGYFARHRVKPGITGWAQVNGLRGETDTLDKMEARVRYDTYYAENWSFLFDLQILARTAFVGFVGKNAY